MNTLAGSGPAAKRVPPAIAAAMRWLASRFGVHEVDARIVADETVRARAAPPRRPDASARG